MQTAGATTIFAVLAALILAITYGKDGISIFFAFLYPLPGVCEQPITMSFPDRAAFRDVAASCR